MACGKVLMPTGHEANGSERMEPSGDCTHDDVCKSLRSMIVLCPIDVPMHRFIKEGNERPRGPSDGADGS